MPEEEIIQLKIDDIDLKALKEVLGEEELHPIIISPVLRGSIRLPSDAHIKAGQTAYNIGLGFWLGYNIDAYKLSIGNPSGSYMTWDGIVVTATNIRIAQTFSASEDISAGDAVYISDGVNGKKAVVDENSTHASPIPFGESGTEYLARSFTLSARARIVSIMIESMGIVGTPTDDVEIALQGDDNGNPDGVDDVVSDAVDVGATDDYEFTLSEAYHLDTGATFWVIIRRTGSLNSENHYDIGCGGTLAGVQKYWNGSNWVTSAECGIEVYALPANEQIAPAEADITGRYENFIGFAPSAINAENSGIVIITGIMTGLSGLTVGQYYLSDTLGAISTSAGTNTRKVGVAISATELLITNIW